MFAGFCTMAIVIAGFFTATVTAAIATKLADKFCVQNNGVNYLNAGLRQARTTAAAVCAVAFKATVAAKGLCVALAAKKNDPFREYRGAFHRFRRPTSGFKGIKCYGKCVCDVNGEEALVEWNGFNGDADVANFNALALYDRDIFAKRTVQGYG